MCSQWKTRTTQNDKPVIYQLQEPGRGRPTAPCSTKAAHPLWLPEAKKCANGLAEAGREQPHPDNENGEASIPGSKSHGVLCRLLGWWPFLCQAIAGSQLGMQLSQLLLSNKRRVRAVSYTSYNKNVFSLTLNSNLKNTC